MLLLSNPAEGTLSRTDEFCNLVRHLAAHAPNERSCELIRTSRYCRYANHIELQYFTARREQRRRTKAGEILRVEHVASFAEQCDPFWKLSVVERDGSSGARRMCIM